MLSIEKKIPGEMDDNDLRIRSFWQTHHDIDKKPDLALTPIRSIESLIAVEFYQDTIAIYMRSYMRSQFQRWVL